MSVTFSPVGDFAAVCDGLGEVVLKDQTGSPSGDPVTALVQPITDREMARSNGRYRSQDVRIHLDAADVAETIIPGWTITSDGAAFTVLEASLETHGDRWNCVGRNLVITEGLDTLVTIQVATTTKGTSGAHAQTWANHLANVRGKITRTEATDTDEQGARTLKRRYTLHMREALDLRRTYRIVGPGNVTYRVTGYRDPESITELTSVDLEVW